MSARNTFVTKFIYGCDKVNEIEAILSIGVDSLHWHGKQDRTAGYFAGIMSTLGEPPYKKIWEILKKVHQHYPDFNMAIVCDDWPDVIDAMKSLWGDSF